jgi:hypothetical protein
MNNLQAVRISVVEVGRMPRRYRFTVVGSLAAVAVLLCIAPPVTPQENMADSALPLELALYPGSQSCIECHSKFYQLWSTSRHGLAMQPYTPGFLPGQFDTAEYLASLTARPDQWSSRYNLGNYYLNRWEVRQALPSYDTALKIEPRAVMVMVNAAMAYAQTGETAQAEKSLL